MNQLEKIEKIEKELAELKAKLQMQKSAYPLFKRSKKTGVVIKFTEQTKGEVVSPDANWSMGYLDTSWAKHTATDLWEDVVCDKERGLFDGQLIWAWDDEARYSRELHFYDAKNGCTLSSCYGGRHGAFFDNYEAYQGQWPEWAVEAYKQLKLKLKL